MTLDLILGSNTYDGTLPLVIRPVYLLVTSSYCEPKCRAHARSFVENSFFPISPPLLGPKYHILRLLTGQKDTLGSQTWVVPPAID